jgi:hypothetical protein
MAAHECVALDTPPVGFVTPSLERDSPASVISSRRELSGTLADNGRYLLLEPAEDDRSGLHFIARDLHGGLEVVVSIWLDQSGEQDPHVERVRLAHRRPSLPLLCSASELDRDNHQDEPVPTTQQIGWLRRLWRRQFTRLRRAACGGV